MRRLAVAGCVATAIGAVIEIALTGLVMPGAIFVAIPLALAVLVWLRSDRISLAIAALVAAVFLYGNLAYPVTMQRLEHPEDIGSTPSDDQGAEDVTETPGTQPDPSGDDVE